MASEWRRVSGAWMTVALSIPVPMPIRVNSSFGTT
jgi:hypothetical protein